MTLDEFINTHESHFVAPKDDGFTKNIYIDFLKTKFRESFKL
jgi:hypothetical protein